MLARMSKKQETARQQYIRVLESVAAKVSELDDQDTQITGELVGGKYLAGEVLPLSRRHLTDRRSVGDNR